MNKVCFIISLCSIFTPYVRCVDQVFMLVYTLMYTYNVYIDTEFEESELQSRSGHTLTTRCKRAALGTRAGSTPHFLEHTKSVDKIISDKCPGTYRRAL